MQRSCPTHLRQGDSGGSDQLALTLEVCGANPALLGSETPEAKCPGAAPAPGLPGEEFTESDPRVSPGPFPCKAPGRCPGAGAAGVALHWGGGLPSRPLQSALFGAVRGRAGLRGPQREASWSCALPHPSGKGSGWLGRAGQVGTSSSSRLGQEDPLLSPTPGPDPHT